MQKTTPKNNTPCPDCGNVPVNHFIEKINATIGKLFLRPAPRLFLYPLYPLAPRFFKFLAIIRLGDIVYEPDASTGGRARCMWLEARRRGITMWEFRLFGVGREIFVAETDGRTIVFEGLPRPALTLSDKNGLPASLAWVDDKSITKKKLVAADIPVAKGSDALTWKRSVEIFRQLEKPVIVKPSTGSRSRHTSLHVADEIHLHEAFLKAKQLSPQVIIEEELVGMVYRGTVIGGQVIGIRRKEPPHTTGDGVHTVRELIDIENSRSERQGPIYSKIKIGDANSTRNINFDQIPEKDLTILLSDTTSINLGAGSTDVTDIAHPDILALLKHIAVTLDDQLVGADFIIADITKSWRHPTNVRSGVIECNSLPFIDVHLFPLNGKARDTAGALWDAVLSKK